MKETTLNKFIDKSFNQLIPKYTKRRQKDMKNLDATEDDGARQVSNYHEKNRDASNESIVEVSMEGLRLFQKVMQPYDSE